MMTIAGILRLSLVFFSLALPVAAVTAASPHLLDWTSVLLAEVLMLILLMTVTVTLTRTNQLCLLVVVGITAFFVSRLFALVILPESIKYEPDNIIFASWELNQTLIYLLVSTVALLGGIVIGGTRRRSANLVGQSRDVDLSPAATAVVAILIFALALGRYLYLGVGRYGENEEMHLVNNVLGSFNPGTAVTLFIVTALERYRFHGKRSVILKVVVLSAYVIARSVMGGKSGAWDILLAWFLYRLARDGNFPIDLNVRALVMRHVPLAVAAIFAIVVTFFVAAEARAVWKNTEYEAVAIDARTLLDTISFDLRPTDVRATLAQITNRMSLLEPLMLVVNNKGIDPSIYLSPMADLKSAINRNVPGTYFDDVIAPERAFSIVFRGRTEEFVAANYQGDDWSLFGLMHIYFGYYGGIIATFLTGFGGAVVFRKVQQLKTSYALLLQIWLLFGALYWFTNLGFDNLSTRLTGWLYEGLVYIVIIRLLAGRSQPAPEPDRLRPLVGVSA